MFQVTNGINTQKGLTLELRDSLDRLIRESKYSLNDSLVQILLELISIMENPNIIGRLGLEE